MGNRQLAVVAEGSGKPIQSYRDLRVWSEAMSLAEMCYVSTRDFPKSEVYGMTSQIRRASVSVPANIAEGYGRDNPGNYIQSLKVAQGSLKELETHVILSQRVGLLPETAAQGMLEKADVIGRMLRSLIRSLQADTSERPQRMPTAKAPLPKRSAP